MAVIGLIVPPTSRVAVVACGRCGARGPEADTDEQARDRWRQQVVKGPGCPATGVCAGCPHAEKREVGNG